MTETSFVPSPDSQRDFREALGCYGTGVTVVTALDRDRPVAMTANSFASVSLDPPLVLWCPAKASQRYQAFLNATHYVIHVLADDQHALALHFARTGTDFAGIDWAPGAAGLPILAGCLARFECERVAVHDGGDHSIVIGRVHHTTFRPGQGLIFKRGLYGGFAGLE